MYTNLDLQKMRQHLHDCITSQHILPFSTTSGYVCASKNISSIDSRINKTNPRTQGQFPCENNLLYQNIQIHNQIHSKEDTEINYGSRRRDKIMITEKRRKQHKKDDTKYHKKEKKNV